MDLKSVYNIFLSTDFVKSLSISHQFFTIFSWKDRIMLSVSVKKVLARDSRGIIRNTAAWADKDGLLFSNRTLT